MALPPMGVEAVIKGLPGFLRGMDQMGDKTQRTGGLLGKIGGLAAKGFVGIGIAAGAAVGAIGAVGGAMFKLAADAAPIAGIGDAFNNLTKDMEGGSKVMLSALQDASEGMVTNTDLMKSFNLASQLVGKDFAEQLPDAMQYLGKVAAATGEDMGFMMDSLVRGVGRLSPMILDNLGIQVDLTAASEDWAKANNRTVVSMSKAEQQAALMAQVLGKLQENTADMPDVAGSAQQAFKSFGIQMKNFKDEVGLAVLPVATELMGVFSELAKKVLPRVVDFVKKYLVPIFEKFASLIKRLVGGEFKLEDIIPPWLFRVWEDFIGVVDKFRKWWETNGPTIMGHIDRIFGTLKDTISNLAQSVIPWIVEQFDKISGWFDEHGEEIQTIIGNIADYFENTLGPAVTNLWDNVLGPFGSDFIDMLLGIGDVLLDVFGGKGSGLGAPFGPRGITLDPGLVELRTPFEKLTDVLNEFFFVKFPEHFKNFRDWVLDFFGLPNWQVVADSWKSIWDSIEIIFNHFVDNIKATFEELKSYLFGGLGEFGFSRGGVPMPSSSPIPAPANVHPAPTFNSGQSSTSNYNLTINTNAPVEPIIADFRTMRAIGGRH